MTEAQAAQARIDIIRGGRHCLYPVPYDQSLALGLPEGYDISDYLKRLEPIVETVSTETAYGRTVNHDFALKVF